MKHLILISTTLTIVFLIYLGMAYVTRMPVNNDVLETNDDNDIVYVKPIKTKPKAKLKPTINSASLSVKPIKTDYSNVLKTQLFSDVNNEHGKVERQDVQELITQSPVSSEQDLIPSMDKSYLNSLLSKPLYPYEAYRNNVDGWVLLKLYISKVGKVTDVDVLDSSPKGVFEAIAVKAAYKKEFPIEKSILDPKAFTKNILTKYGAGS